MILTNAFTCVGALLCAVAAWGEDGVYWELIGYRFLLGIGIGGKYPLAATVRAEAAGENEHRSTEVAKGFFWQTPGVIVPYMVAWCLVKGESLQVAHVCLGFVSNNSKIICRVIGFARRRVRGGQDWRRI